MTAIGNMEHREKTVVVPNGGSIPLQCTAEGKLITEGGGITAPDGSQLFTPAVGSSHETSSTQVVAIKANVGTAITTATTTLVATITDGRIPKGFTIDGLAVGGVVNIYAGITAVNLIATLRVRANETVYNAFEGFPITTGLTVVTDAAMEVTPTWI